MRTCTVCGHQKPPTEFHKDSHATDGISRRCKPCAIARTKAHYQANRERILAERKKPPGSQRPRQLWAKYRLTEERFDEILESQGGGCAVCGSDPADEPPVGKRAGRRSMCVDHDHSCCRGPKSCGKCVRGILCSRCNRALGLMRDDPAVLGAAIRYLGGTL